MTGPGRWQVFMAAFMTHLTRPWSRLTFWATVACVAAGATLGFGISQWADLGQVATIAESIPLEVALGLAGCTAAELWDFRRKARALDREPHGD